MSSSLLCICIIYDGVKVDLKNKDLKLANVVALSGGNTQYCLVFLISRIKTYFLLFSIYSKLKRKKNFVVDIYKNNISIINVIKEVKINIAIDRLHILNIILLI